MCFVEMFFVVYVLLKVYNEGVVIIICVVGFSVGLICVVLIVCNVDFEVVWKFIVDEGFVCMGVMCRWFIIISKGLMVLVIN